MSERQFTRSCPHFGAISPLSAPVCLRCNCSLPPATVGQTAAFSYKRTISWIAGALLAAALLLVAAGAGLLHAHLSSTMAYQEALRLAKASPAVQAVLGEDVHLRSAAFGVAFTGHGSEFVQFSIALAGSRGAGHLYAVANSIHQNLQFSRLSFLPEAGTQYIDLTPVPQRLSLPPVPAKKVYLIPMGLSDSEPLDWAQLGPGGHA